MAFFVNASGHDADFASSRRDNARAVRTDETRLLEINGCRDAHHFQQGNAFRDADDERQLRIGGFQNRVGRKGRRNEDHGRVRARASHRFGDGIEYGPLEVLRGALARSDAAYNVGAVLDHLLRVEGAFAPGEALNDEARFLADEDAHRAPPASATTFCAPSFMPFAMVKFRPLSRRICWPSSTLVPSMRTTTGTFT